MAWAPLTVVVPGFAATLTATKVIAEPWKLAVAEAVRDGWADGLLREPVHLELRFGLPRARFTNTALFNLLKSTIDGLSQVIFHPTPSGQPGLWSHEDWWVTSLVAEKHEIREPWVQITISASRPEPEAARSEKPLLTAVIPGEPPLWPGDAAGQKRVLDWRERAVAICGPHQIECDHIGGRVEFVVAPSRMQLADIDNLCVPAAQTLVRIAFGDMRDAAKLVAIEATKRAATGAETPHTRVELFLP